MIDAGRFFFRNNLGQRLTGRIYHASAALDTGIVFSHGLFSSKDGYKITRLSDAIVSTGIPLMTFDFSFAGESEGRIADLSVLQETKDLAAAIRWASDNLGWRRFHLMGSSMGAAVTLLYASEYPAVIESLVLIATPVDLRRLVFAGAGLDATALSSLPEEGTRTVDGIEVRTSFFRELAGIDMAAAARKIECPVLAFHGGRDAVVDPENVRLLGKHLSGPLRTILIDDGDHNLTRDGDIRLIGEKITGWLAGGYRDPASREARS
ncbi:MAG: alpha/beta fold hydrolase [Spirochaetes bacterium]|nr:alpha/beta fold hydrolase [Spirochaetota bacterium]